MKLTKGKIIAAVVIVAALVISFVWGGGYAWQTMPPETSQPVQMVTAVQSEGRVTPQALVMETVLMEQTSETLADSAASPDSKENQQISTESLLDQSSSGVETGSLDYAQSQGMAIDPETGKDQYLTDPVPEGKPIPVEPQAAVISDMAMTCTLSVRCETILNNIDWLDKEKVELVPADGVIFPAAEVTFYQGESVFNVLLREMKLAKIHMEFENTPIYNSAYIEGINNLYEFDCGELSGWMYKVNDWFPNYGCSRYQLQQGDVVEWVYTCDLGRDIGGYYAVGSAP